MTENPTEWKLTPARLRWPDDFVDPAVVKKNYACNPPLPKCVLHGNRPLSATEEAWVELRKNR